MSGFDPPKYIASLTGAINDGAKAAQTGAFAFGLVGLLLLATAFSATDEDLLLDHTLAIAQLGAAIPVTVSFAMMPILFLALHVFTLIRYDMLAANLRQFRTDLAAMVPLAADRERCRQLLANVEFIQSLTAPEGSALRSRVFGFVSWLVIAGFPVIVLLAVQINALRYQSEMVTLVQRLCLIADLALLLWFFRRQQINRGEDGLSPGGRLLAWLPLYGLALILVLDFAYVNVPDADSTTVRAGIPFQQRLTRVEGESPGRPPYRLAAVQDMILAVPRQPLDLWLCPELHWGCRFLKVDHRILVGKVWDNKAIIELGAGEALTQARRASFEGVFLRGRSLRFADLSESRLYAADMIGVDLRQATLFNTQFQGANMFVAQLQGANMQGAQMQGADMQSAQMQGADMSNAQIQGADMQSAQMQGANMSNAQLQDANMMAAQMQGSNMENAQMQGADMSNAQIQGADMRCAQMQGANMSNVQLQGANMMAAQMQGTNMENAQMQGADMRSARIWQTSFQETQFDLTDLRGADSEEPLASDDVRKLLESVSPQTRQRIGQTLTPRELKAEERKAVAAGSVLVDAETKLRPALAPAIAAQSTKDEAAFDAKLAPVLAAIAASSPAAASGIARRLEAASSTEGCRYADLAGRLLAAAKEARISLDADTLQRLQLVADPSRPDRPACPPIAMPDQPPSR